MIDYFYNGDNYKMVVNTKLFACINVLFMGVVFIEGRRFKKYVSASNTLYLVEY